MANLNMSYLIEFMRDRATADKEFQKLNDFLIERNCSFRGEALPTFLKPYFISPKQTTTLQKVVTIISNVLNKFINYYLENEEVQKIMAFSKEENELFNIEPGYSVPLVISRLDAFMDDYDIQFLEFNCDSPAGTAYADVLEEGFAKFLDKYSILDYWKIKYYTRQEPLLNALIACYNEFKGSKRPSKKPTIAIVDWDDVSTLSEFELLKVFFEAKGYPTIITTPQKLKIKNGVLTSDDEPIDIVYRRVIQRELLQRRDDAEDFIQAAKDGLVCMANPFRSFIVGNKKVLAILTDPNYQSIYTREELNIIRNCIPWTQVLSDKKVMFNNFTVNLRTFIYDNREKLVLKPASSYGGKDVFIGRDTDEETWHKIVNENIESESWVVQQYVTIPEDIFPDIRNGNVEMRLKKVNINPFAIYGKYAGTISRISESSVINVSAGGGLIPTMSVSKK